MLPSFCCTVATKKIQHATQNSSSSLFSREAVTGFPHPFSSLAPLLDFPVISLSPQTITKSSQKPSNKMLPDAPDIFTLIVCLTWLAVTFERNGIALIYHQILTSKDVVTDMLTHLDMTFHPDLFAILHADTPPPVSWFKAFGIESFPVKGLWGIYFLLLEKPGAVPFLYIGSRTSSVLSGVRHRLQSHFTTGPHPARVQKAYDDGYKLTSFGLLASCNKPTAGDVPRTRILLVAVEAVSTWLLWTLPEYTKGHNFPPRAIWTTSELPWHGASTHNPLIIGVKGDFGVTKEQLEEAQALAAAKRQASHRAWIKANPEKMAKFRKDFVKKRKKAKLHWCDVCKIAFPAAVLLQTHLKTDRHKENARNGGLKVYPHACDVCEHRSFRLTVQLRRHKETKSHKDNVKAPSPETWYVHLPFFDFFWLKLTNISFCRHHHPGYRHDSGVQTHWSRWFKGFVSFLSHVVLILEVRHISSCGSKVLSVSRLMSSQFWS